MPRSEWSRQIYVTAAFVSFLFFYEEKKLFVGSHLLLDMKKRFQVQEAAEQNKTESGEI